MMDHDTMIALMAASAYPAMKSDDYGTAISDAVMVAEDLWKEVRARGKRREEMTEHFESAQRALAYFRVKHPHLVELWEKTEEDDGRYCQRYCQAWV
jgi:hypothetical protein